MCTNFGDSLQYRWTSSLEQSADGPQTAGLVIQPFLTVADGVLIWSVGPKCSVNLPITVLYKLSYFVLLTLFHDIQLVINR